VVNSQTLSLNAVLTVSRLKETRLSQSLQLAEQRLIEQQTLLQTLVDYGEEYRNKITAMDCRDLHLTQESLLRRQNLLAMIGKIDSMIVAQSHQVKIATGDVQRIKLAFQKARLYAENLEEFRDQKLLALQIEAMKKEEKNQYDEYLTRFSMPAPN